MFKSLIYFPNSRRGFTYSYDLRDTDFNVELHITLTEKASSERGPRCRAQRIVACIQEYKKRNLPIVLNIAHLFLSEPEIFCSKKEDHSFDRNWIDKHFPQLEYGKKYYPCILRQYSKLIGKRI